MQNLDHSPAATANAAESRPEASRPRGRRETPWAAYAIKGGLATLAMTAMVGLVFALSSGVWASAIAAVVALLALAAVARPTWRMLDATYGRPVRGPRTSTESSQSHSRHYPFADTTPKRPVSERPVRCRRHTSAR